MVNTIIVAIIVAIVTLSIERIFNNFPKIKKTIELAIKLRKKKHMMEKNIEWSGGLPIFKSSKGYLFTVSDDKKSMFCDKCYTSTSKLTRLEHIGGKFSKNIFALYVKQNIRHIKKITNLKQYLTYTQKSSKI